MSANIPSHKTRGYRFFFIFGSYSVWNKFYMKHTRICPLIIKFFPIVLHFFLNKSTNEKFENGHHCLVKTDHFKPQALKSLMCGVIILLPHQGSLNIYTYVFFLKKKKYNIGYYPSISCIFFWSCLFDTIFLVLVTHTVGDFLFPTLGCKQFWCR